MKIYKDLLTNDEMLSDAFVLKEVDGIFYEVEGKVVTEGTSIDDSMFGGNKSAEDTGENDTEESGVTGINIVIRHQLQEVGGQQFDYKKKDYKVHIKKYMKKISERLEPGQVADFKKNANAAVLKVLERFDDFQLFRGASTDPDLDEGECMLALAEYRGTTPYMLFFKHGLLEEKV